MAVIFKPFLSDDVTTARTLLHESIPIAASIVSGTYGAFGTNERNIKNYSHGMFQSVYDYPYMSSSANHVFDIACGYSSLSPLSASGNNQNSKKIAIYNQLAQVLVGHDVTGSILRFDKDGDLTSGGISSGKLDEVYFINLSRLTIKDEIKKGTFNLQIQTGSAHNTSVSTAGTLMTIQDHGAETEYRVNSPAGEYGILYSGSQATAGTGVGLLYYQAGIAVLTGSIFKIANRNDGTQKQGSTTIMTQTTENIDALLTGSTIQIASDSIRHRINSLSFNNTTELNSTIYFCRIGHNEFNYSANPTYTSGSRIRVKNQTTDQPVSYFTTVGLYSADNELLAVAKLSEPIRKDPTNELMLRVRLDY